ncbi:uncharacterized protein LOC135247231 isoform X2 [Anguilla rostrata]|uniref:uncharacterized protein LOC135247231 isoform X2 n=1 Tax=Anguilla rostrata TaxID=7938 RepID=UPI0030CC964A
MTNVIFVASADKYKNASISTEVDKERFSSERYDGSNFPLRISPVKFGDSGRYFCHCDAHSNLMASVTLVTVQVSSVPPGGLSRNQSVVLNCEISQVIGSVTLAWLRMKGGRGELVKQEVLSQGHPKNMLSLTLPILSRDQLHWACAVFTESMLRAQVPLHLTLTTPVTEPEESKSDNGWVLVIGLACTAAVCVGVLLLLFLLFRRLKTAAGPSTSPAEGNGAADAVYSDVTDLQQGQVDGNGDSSAAAAVYSNVAELQKDQDPHRQQRRQLNPQSRSEQEENDKVIYASVCKT